MKFLPFVLKHLRATWVRTASTVVAMALCVFLFCTLQSVLAHFDRFVDSRSPRRLVTRNAVSLIERDAPHPRRPDPDACPGVKRVAATVGFGGVLPARREGKAGPGDGAETDWTAVFQNLAVEAEPYFAMSPELVVAPDQFRDFLNDLRGCVIGRQLAREVRLEDRRPLLPAELRRGHAQEERALRVRGARASSTPTRASIPAWKPT